MRQPTSAFDFECVGATVYFIYSFVLSDEAKTRRIVINARDIYERYQACERSGKATNVGRDYPEARKGISPHLSLYSDAAWFEYPELAGHVADRKVRIARLARVFPTGATCCISLTIKRDESQRISTAEIEALLGLVEGRANKEAISLRITHPNEEQVIDADSVYELFETIVNDLRHCAQVEWLGKTGDDSNRFFRDTRETQNPWVVTVLDVAGEEAKAFCGRPEGNEDPALVKKRRIKRYERSIAPVLFRAVSEDFELEPAYPLSMDLRATTEFASINIDANLFVQTSRRSILCISRDQRKDPARYFVPGLLDLCEMVRARWHALILMNKRIDWALRALREGGNQLDKKREIITIREWLGTSLEDPAIYVIAGDALTKIHRTMTDTTGIRDLQEMLLGKMALLDRVYKDLVTMRFLEDDE